jgi:hypothetical protein
MAWNPNITTSICGFFHCTPVSTHREEGLTLRDLRYPPRCGRHLRSEGMLCWLKLVTRYRSFEATYRSHLQGSNSSQRTLDRLSLEDATVMLFRNFVNPYQPRPRNIYSWMATSNIELLNFLLLRKFLEHIISTFCAAWYDCSENDWKLCKRNRIRLEQRGYTSKEPENYPCHRRDSKPELGEYEILTTPVRKFLTNNT